MTQTHYQFSTRVQLPYEEAVQRVTAELKKEGFGVLTEIDMKATLKKKLDIDYPPYIILGACNPPSAYKALNIEIGIGLLLPCNVIVYEDNGETIVSAVDPAAMLGVGRGVRATYDGGDAFVGGPPAQLAQQQDRSRQMPLQ